MMYFVEYVTLYSFKTAKARPIQAAASQFEHTMLSEAALKALIGNLKLIVDICNRTFRGNELNLSHHPWGNNSGGQISVRYPASGTEKMIVSISYAPVLCDLNDRSQVREEIQTVLGLKHPDICAKYIVEYTKKGGAL